MAVWGSLWHSLSAFAKCLPRHTAAWRYHRHTADTISCCSSCSREPSDFFLQKRFSKKMTVCAAGNGHRLLGEAFNQAPRQGLAVLDNNVCLVHTAVRTEAWSLVQDGGHQRWVGRGWGTAWRLGYPSSLRRRKEKHSSSSLRDGASYAPSVRAHTAHALLHCAARPSQLPAVSPLGCLNVKYEGKKAGWTVFRVGSGAELVTEAADLFFFFFNKLNFVDLVIILWFGLPLCRNCKHVFPTGGCKQSSGYVFRCNPFQIAPSYGDGTSAI